MHIHPRSVAHKTFDIWRTPGRFTKNPDIVELPSGAFLLVYADTDAHWSQVNQVLTILASEDRGRTWSKRAEVDAAVMADGDHRLVTPRLSRLADGRLAVICDHDDHSFFHEDQPAGNWIWWSEDEGHTWSPPCDYGIMGFEPDRILDLPDGSLAVGTHIMFGETQELGEILTVSEDGGASWQRRAVVAHDGHYRYCEGALVILDGGRELACLLRENHHGGTPSFVVFSQDDGRTWSPPAMCPFALDRPYGKQLADGRVLVTGRHVNGPLGTYGWCGDLKRETGYRIGGPRRKYQAQLTDAGLAIDNLPGHECRYRLLPPENALSEVTFSARLRVEGADFKPSAYLSIAHLGVVLHIAANGVWTRPGADFLHPLDMTQARHVALIHRRGWLQVQVDGQTVINQCVFRESAPLGDARGGGTLGGYSAWGQPSVGGRSVWHSASYAVRNRTLDDFAWSWQAKSGQWPDQYQKERLIQIHGNHPAQLPAPDHGYSSWIQLADGRVYLVDYTNYGDSPGNSHLVGVYLEPEDIA